MIIVLVSWIASQLPLRTSAPVIFICIWLTEPPLPCYPARAGAHPWHSARHTRLAVTISCQAVLPVTPASCHS